MILLFFRNTLSRFQFRWLLFGILVLPTAVFGSADSLISGLRIESKVHYGFIYPHHSAIEYLLAGNISGIEVSMSKQTYGKQPWEELYRYPRYGVAYNFNSFGNPDVLGNSHALFGFFDASLFKPQRAFSLNYQIGMGLGYITRKYEPYDNPMNLAISANVNVYISLDFSARWKIGAKNELKTSLELSHFSNGKLKSPNLGLNTVSLSAAWLYSLTADNPKILLPAPVHYKRHFTEVVWNAGVKRDDMLNEKIYAISTIVADYNYAVSPKYAFGGGLDFFYDGSLRPTKEYELEIPSEKGDNLQIGTHMGARSRYGRMNVILNVGYYVYADFYKYSGMYSRIGFRYMLNDYLLFNMSIKAHYAIADYVEWGIGYRFKTKGL